MISFNPLPNGTPAAGLHPPDGESPVLRVATAAATVNLPGFLIATEALF
jgi:hypothetical protein